MRSGAFSPRPKEAHEQDILARLENPTLKHTHGVKRQCPLTDKLEHFSFVSGYPPDLIHNLFEGIVTYELALCIDLFITNKYITLTELNYALRRFPYKWTDLRNIPYLVPHNLEALVEMHTKAGPF